MVNTKPMEFQQEPLMVYLIKCLAEVHDYDICLTTLRIESIMHILSEMDQLCFTADPAPENNYMEGSGNATIK